MWGYFTGRGGVDSFGYPVTRSFGLLGFPVQVFQRHVLQVWADGSVHPMNLLDPDVMPATSVNFSRFPAHDPAVAAAAPPPGTPDYGTAVLAQLQAAVPALNRLFAGMGGVTGRGVLGSEDGGATWGLVGSLDIGAVADLALDPARNVLYAGTATGLWRLAGPRPLAG